MTQYTKCVWYRKGNKMRSPLDPQIRVENKVATKIIKKLKTSELY